MKLQLPKLGARTIKTALVVFLCLVTFKLIGRDGSLMACISGIICMQNNIEESLNNGKDRLLGTAFGAIIGLVFSILASYNTNWFILAILASFGVIASIYLCLLLETSSSATMACIVFLSIFINVGQVEWFRYSLDRIIDTFIGVCISITVNKHIFKKSFKKENQ